MQQSLTDDWIPIDPDFGNSGAARARFLEFARELRDWSRNGSDRSVLAEKRAAFVSSVAKGRSKQRPRLKAVGLLIADLAEQGWAIRVRSEEVDVLSPSLTPLCNGEAKELVRRQELIKRDAQLKTDSVRRFVESMERERIFEGRSVSISSLMRDGAELAQTLRGARDLSQTDASDALSAAVSPYVEFVRQGERCRFTGLRLMDVWRYFRHTWTNQYTSVPGRTMMFLVRDAAADCHPVVGIAALSSAVVQLGERDKWIGWDTDTAFEELRRNPSAATARWLAGTVERGISEIYIADFVKEGLLTRHSVAHPSDSVVQRLLAEGVRKRRAHQQHATRRDYEELDRTRSATTKFWRSKAQTPLYRSKRAFALAGLLRARIALQEHFGASPTAAGLRSLLRSKCGQDAVRQIIKKAKDERVGTAIADISVCGAVPPYNALLGGKLVSMLATTPQVLAEYKRRYEQAESEIASGIAGRPICRPANLVYLGTTSLYGTQSSQYNRVRIPYGRRADGAAAEVKFHRLGKSESFGTSHYSDATVTALVSLVEGRNSGRRVASIFGEGGSPKLRKIREGLDLLGLPSRALLKHGRRRIIYGVPLASNMKEYLLGRHKHPRYYVSLRAPEAKQRATEWWTQRWLAKRIQSESVLDAVAQHTLASGSGHGAQVPLPGGTRLAAPHTSNA